MHNSITVLSQGPHHIAVYKPHNMSVVGGPGVVRPTLLDLMREQFGKSIFPVHRLDRVTAGITLFARSVFAKHALDNAFKKRLVHKVYWAIVEGTPEFSTTTVNQKLQRVDTAGKKTGSMAHQITNDQGQTAITHVKVIKKIKENYWLIEAIPVSGRLHQIRAHLASLHLPIVGDKLYGAKSSFKDKKIALCAVEITFPLPKGGKITIDARKFFDTASYCS